MTLAVVWYRERFDELWCAADSRISRGDRPVTDTGTKIFSLPVVCHEHTKDGEWITTNQYSFGFAFSGNTLAASSTHSIVSACTQNLASDGSNKKICLESIVSLYQTVGERQMIEMSSRLGAAESKHTYCFDAFVFGFCPRESRYKAYVLVSSFAGGPLQINVAEINIAPGFFLSIGSGETGFLNLMEELKGHPEAGVLTTLKEMVSRELQADVGGSLQIGVSNRKGFRLCPILDTSNGPGKAFVSFLGWDATSFKDIDGFTIGYSAIKP